MVDDDAGGARRSSGATVTLLDANGDRDPAGDPRLSPATLGESRRRPTPAAPGAGTSRPARTASRATRPTAATGRAAAHGHADEPGHERRAAPLVRAADRRERSAGAAGLPAGGAAAAAAARRSPASTSTSFPFRARCSWTASRCRPPSRSRSARYRRTNGIVSITTIRPDGLPADGVLLRRGLRAGARGRRRDRAGAGAG